MRILIVILVGILFLGVSCKSKKIKDVSKVENLTIVTDSLMNLVQSQYDFNSERLYLISDDSLKADSLAQSLHLPDSIGIYQYLERRIFELDEIIAQTKKEIGFAKDQLTTLKNEFLDNKISETEYKSEISDLNDMVLFLKERIDSNILLINQAYNNVPISKNDSVPQ